MKINKPLIFIIFVLFYFLLLSIVSVQAATILPENIQEFKNDCGYICYVWPDGSGDCYPCLQDCKPPVYPTQNPTVEPTPTETRDPTKTQIAPTIEPTQPEPTSTSVPIPTRQPVCYQWLCHKPDTNAEQDYCCDSDGCVNAHLKHGDYLGKCENRNDDDNDKNDD